MRRARKRMGKYHGCSYATKARLAFGARESKVIDGENEGESKSISFYVTWWRAPFGFGACSSMSGPLLTGEDPMHPHLLVFLLLSESIIMHDSSNRVIGIVIACLSVSA